jgi:hypothetical protein
VTRQAVDAGWTVDAAAAHGSVRVWKRDFVREGWHYDYEVRVAMREEANSAVVGWVLKSSTVGNASEFDGPGEYADDVFWPQFDAIVLERP